MWSKVCARTYCVRYVYSDNHFIHWHSPAIQLPLKSREEKKERLDYGEAPLVGVFSYLSIYRIVSQSGIPFFSFFLARNFACVAVFFYSLLLLPLPSFVLVRPGPSSFFLHSTLILLPRSFPLCVELFVYDCTHTHTHTHIVPPLRLDQSVFAGRSPLCFIPGHHSQMVE